MLLPLFFLCFFIMALSATMLGFALLRPDTTLAPVHRLEQLTGRVAAKVAAEQDRFSGPAEAIAAFIRRRAAWLDTADLRRQYLQAGWRDEEAQNLHLSSRLVLPVFGFVLALALPGPTALWITLTPCLLYLLTGIFLSRKIAARRKAIRRGMPDMLDLLVICMEASLGIDQALMRVALEMGETAPELQDELLQISREQRAGKPRHEAWQEAIARLDIAEMEAFMNMMLQSERFGTPLAAAMRQYANDVHAKRVQTAEEKAAKTTIKIIFPLAVFSFPSIFIVILGPAALSLFRSF